jgi:hypothetical protein
VAAHTFGGLRCHLVTEMGELDYSALTS